MIRRMMISALVLVHLAAPQTANRLKSPTPLGQGADTAGRLWTDPGEIEQRNLLYGSGGEAKRPKSDQFLFVKEDMEGTSPKFVVKDADGVEWKVKLGPEARPETAASRFVWAAGYFTRDYYFLPSIRVENLPHLHRGNEYVQNGSVVNARLMRDKKSLKKIGEWTWAESPFVGTREYNGLRAMMGLLNNWDLKDVNNAIYEEKDEEAKEQAKEQKDPFSVSMRRLFMVSDLGASFGTAGIVKGKSTSRGNLESYKASKFLESVKPDVVDFAAPGRPQWTVLVVPQQYIRRTHMQWIGNNVPRQDAAWLGELLSRLSPAQIRDAFRAAAYSPEEVEGFAQVVEGRIAALKALATTVQ